MSAREGITYRYLLQKLVWV